MKNFALAILLFTIPSGLALGQNLFPGKLGMSADLKITVVKPARWPWNPFRCWAMRVRGEKPQPRPGRSREIRIEGTWKIK